MSLAWIPEEPPLPLDQHARGRVTLRYEDVSQDGRLVLESLPNALGEIWRQIAHTRPASFGRAGVLPILSRVIVEGGEGPVPVRGPAEAVGHHQLAHTVGADGEVDRIVLVMWARVMAPLGRTQGPQPADAGRPLVAGRVFAEHVFTRPFAPPDQRRVRSIDLDDGTSLVPEIRYPWRDPEALLALPEGATPLDAEPVPDDAATMFGLDHTDSNHHVNSLVYPRLFIEAALRRFHAHGEATPPRLARAIEIAYRKPCFAGERARIVARAFMLGDRPGITAALVGENDAPGARARCMARVLFDV